MKKKLIIAMFLLGSITITNAQSINDITKAANTANSAAHTANSVANAANAAAKSFNVATISNQVMGLLVPKLKLTEAQKPAVLALVNETLNKKKNILPTLATNKAAYTSQMTSTRETFLTKMKKTVSKDQFLALTALLPKSAASVATPLVQMLY